MYCSWYISRAQILPHHVSFYNQLTHLQTRTFVISSLFFSFTGWYFFSDRVVSEVDRFQSETFLSIEINRLAVCPSSFWFRFNYRCSLRINKLIGWKEHHIWCPNRDYITFTDETNAQQQQNRIFDEISAGFFLGVVVFRREFNFSWFVENSCKLNIKKQSINSLNKKPH